MFKEGDRIYKIKGSIFCLVRWARDDRFGWVPEEYKDEKRAGDVTFQGDPDFELVEKVKPKRVKRKKSVRVRRVKKKRVIRKKLESKNNGGTFF